MKRRKKNHREKGSKLESKKGGFASKKENLQKGNYWIVTRLRNDEENSRLKRTQGSFQQDAHLGGNIVSLRAVQVAGTT